MVTSSSIVSSVPVGSGKSYRSHDVREDLNLGSQTNPPGGLKKCRWNQGRREWEDECGRRNCNPKIHIQVSVRSPEVHLQ